MSNWGGRVFLYIQFLRDTFGNPPSLFCFLQAYGFTKLKLSAVDKWFQRGAIPSDWFGVVLALLEIDRGAPVNVSAYIKLGLEK
jgi:hypothetical protein